jgi:hypothetical protein
MVSQRSTFVSADLIFVGLFGVVYDDDFYRAFGRFQFQPPVFPQLR